jgi:hypothetical protein
MFPIPDFFEAQTVEMFSEEQVTLERVGRIEPLGMERRVKQPEA